MCDEIWRPLSETVPSRSKTIAANRSVALNQLFVDAKTNANIGGTRWAGYQGHHEPCWRGSRSAGARRAGRHIESVCRRR